MDETTRSTYDTWVGSEVVDREGDKIGKVTDIFYDDQTGRPEWLAVKTGLFGSNDTFVPIQGTTLDVDNRIVVAYDKDMVKGAPNVVEGDHMSPQEEAQLWSYYGYDYTDAKAINYGYGESYRTGERADRDYSYSRYDASTQDWGEDRQQEEVVAEATAVSEDVQKVERPETVRLRKYRRTEMVPVTKEEVRVEKDTDTKIRSSTTPSNTTSTTTTSSTRRDA